MSSAQVRGRSHARLGKPCQDRAASLSSNGVRIVALADGAGSATLSHRGAETALNAAMNLVATSFESLCSIDENEVAQSFSEKLTDTLSREAEARDCDPFDLSSTLLLAAVSGWQWLALHVGDGVIGIYDTDELHTLSTPENGRYQNETWFTTSPTLKSHLRVYRGDAMRVSGFILLSDGVQPSLYDARTQTLTSGATGLLYANARLDPRQMDDVLHKTIEISFVPRTRDDCSVALLSRTRFRNFDEYEKYKHRIARRVRRNGDSNR